MNSNHYNKKRSGPNRNMRVKGKNHKIVVSDSTQFVDHVYSAAVNNSVVRYSLLTDMMNLLASVPQMTDAILVNGSIQWHSRIVFSHVELRLLCIGSQSNTLVAGDIFNNMRILVAETRESWAQTSTAPLVGVTDPLNLIDTRVIHLDKLVSLSSRAFNGAGYNSPGIESDVININLNRAFDIVTPVALGTSGWDTKYGDIEIFLASDSTVTPHPTIVITTRLFYKILKNAGNRDGQ